MTTILDHGPIQELITDVFVIRSARCPRTTTILRRGQSLVMVDGMRLHPATEAHVERLGHVEHLVRLGPRPDPDEVYLRARWGGRPWAPPPSGDASELEDGHASFLEGTQVFVFRSSGGCGEAALIFEHSCGNVLITADDLVTVARSSVTSGAPSTRGGALDDELERLLEHDFAHVICGHGDATCGGAKDALRRRLARAS
jgi:hypothetical protein